MSEIENNAPRGLERRTVLKGAAWATPVIAAAVATPLASASVEDNWDVTVSGTCSGQAYFDVPIAGGIINTILSILGVTRATREFTITVNEGPLPQDAEFILDHGGLLNANLISPTGILGATVIGLGPNTARITIPAGTPAGSTLTINLLDALLDVTALASVSLSLVGNDNPTTAPGGLNSATVSTLVGSSTSVTVPFVGTFAVALQLCG